MKTLDLFCVGALLGLGFWFGPSAFSQETSTPPAEEKPDPSAEMMAKMMELSQPGEHHAHLKPLEGNWTYAVKYRMTPDAEFMEGTGTIARKWVLYGRFLTEEVAGEGGEPQPFQGIGYMGYDNFKKKYTTCWMDSMGTAVVTTLGTCNDSGKTFTFTGEYDDPMTGQTKKSHHVLKIVSDDKHVYEGFDVGPDGKEFKSFELVCTRK